MGTHSEEGTPGRQARLARVLEDVARRRAAISTGLRSRPWTRIATAVTTPPASWPPTFFAISSTSVTMSVEAKPKGALRFLPKAMLEAASRDEMEATMARLKVRLETG